MNSKQDFMKPQTYVLGVNLSCKCNGCTRRIKKQLQKIDGVYGTSIEPEQGKVSVTGNVDPHLLIKKLERSGKHARIWSSDNKTKNADQFDVVSSQLKNLPMSNKVEEDGEEGGGYGKQHNKQIAIQQVLQEMKASKDEEDGDDDDDVVDPKNKVVHIMGNGDEGKVAGEDKKGGGGMMSVMIAKAMRGKGGGIYGKLGKKGGGEGEVTTKGGGGGNLPVAQGIVAAPVMPMASLNGGGGGGGVGPMMGNPYQQQQYMGMMNQQGTMNGGGAPYGYGWPQPWEGYVPPPVYTDPATNMFSDENPEGCSIM